MKIVHSVCLLTGLLGLSAMGVACDGPVDRFTDCAEVCDRYSTCFDESYDVEECTTTCDDMAQDDEDADSRLDRCESCLDDRACAEATFTCTDDCVGIMP